MNAPLPLKLWLRLAAFSAVLAFSSSLAAEESQPTNTFLVAAYNVENWLTMERWGKEGQPKPARQKKAVLDVIESLRPDVLGLCEIGTKADFEELAQALGNRGLDYPHREWLQAANLDRHLALLSRFPIVGRHSRTNDTYSLEGKKLRIERGILDVEIKVNDAYSFRAIMVHLKSRRATDIADQAQMRLNEARLLRNHIESALEKNPKLNLIVMGDLNDTPDSEPVHVVIGDNPLKLLDLKPVDSEGRYDTHLWRAKNLFSRIDYLLVSGGMFNEFVEGSARIADPTGWEKGSDHRAITARFIAREAVDPVANRESPAMQQSACVYMIVALAVVGALRNRVLR